PLIRKLLAKDPDQRFQRGRDIVAALDALAQQPAAPAPAANNEKAAPIPMAAVRPSESEASGIKLESRLRTREVKEKAGLLSSQYLFDIYLMADDFKQFQGHFEKLTEELFSWGQQRGKKCGRIQFKATIHPWITGQ